MFRRLAEEEVRAALRRVPAVALLGARQVGKTTLARKLAAAAPGSVYLDLERPADVAKLAEPELFLGGNRERLVVIDEVQRVPGLFPILRAEIDERRRAGRFLLLGSASPELLRQSSESLAGRIAMIDMQPLLASEVRAGFDDLQTLWLRGGFPESYLSRSDRDSFRWRDDFIRTFLERDLPQFGVQVAAPVLSRFWRMLAHLHGQLFNAAQLAASMGVSSPTIARWIDIFQATGVIRRLEPLHANLGKRLVKSPKIYIADSGLLHALLNIASVNDLQGHPVVGASWEGFVLGQVLGQRPRDADVTFYRSAAGAEIDVVLIQAKRRIAIEIKFSAAPKPTKGFWLALDDLGIAHAYVVAPIRDAYPIANNVEVFPAHRIHELFDVPARETSHRAG